MEELREDRRHQGFDLSEKVVEELDFFSVGAAGWGIDADEEGCGTTNVGSCHNVAATFAGLESEIDRLEPVVGFFGENSHTVAGVRDVNGAFGRPV